MLHDVVVDDDVDDDDDCDRDHVQSTVCSCEVKYLRRLRGHSSFITHLGEPFHAASFCC